MKQYYKIGEISSLYNIGTDSLRYYEEIGILSPKRDTNGYRMYSIGDIRTLNVLRELRSIGFSMEEIKNHLSGFNLDSTMDLFKSEIHRIDLKLTELRRPRSAYTERAVEPNVTAAAQREPLLFKSRCLPICVGAGDQFSIDIDLHHAIVLTHYMRQMQIAVIHRTGDGRLCTGRHIIICAISAMCLFAHRCHLMSGRQPDSFILII